MKPFPLPVIADGLIGRGTQAEAGEDFNYMPVSHEVETFSMPEVPANADAVALARAGELLDGFAATMLSPTRTPVELVKVAPAVVEVLNQTLGEGEVSVRIGQSGAARQGLHDVRIQETVFAGVWRQRQYASDGSVTSDLLLAAPIPPLAVELAEAMSSPVLPALAAPPGAMNAPALLTEIRAAVSNWRPGREPRVINLTLLPLTPDDIALLERALPPGQVAVLSRGFGNCRVSSTTIRHVWRVQYFNSMQTLILNTLEVTRVPEVAVAADEDLADSQERLRDLVQWMRESVAA